MITPGEHLQRGHRTGRFFTDQDGRKFYAEADSLSQQPIGELRPSGFSAPWLPPMRFAKFAKDGELTFQWDYQSMADELAADTAAYYEHATKFALEHNLPVPDVGGVLDRRITAVFGPAPISPEVPLSAQAGDAWLLGRPGAPRNDDVAAILNQGTSSTGNDALKVIRERIARRMETAPVPVVAEPDTDGPVTYNQFIAEGRKRGMPMADLAIAWKAHKENSAPLAAVA